MGSTLTGELPGDSIAGLQTTLVHHHLQLPVVGVPVSVAEHCLAVLLVGMFCSVAADILWTCSAQCHVLCRYCSMIHLPRFECVLSMIHLPRFECVLCFSFLGMGGTLPLLKWGQFTIHDAVKTIRRRIPVHQLCLWTLPLFPTTFPQEEQV